jgi:hypothetical protein
VLSVCTSYRLMMALASGVSKTCARALVTCVSSCTDRSARYFIMLKAHSPQGTVGHVTALELISTER